ncbi:MAG: oligosaccharide flippase family protein [Clostridia bacterium]|nr:oligosaccharide flippase family protein [Clostridia bacterium]
MSNGFLGRGLKVPAKASLWYTVSGALAKGVGLLFTPIFTRIMSRGEYGRYTLYITVLALMSVVCTSGVTGSAMYKGLIEFSDGRRKFTASAVGLSLCTVIPVCLAVFLLRGVLLIEGIFVPFLFIQLIFDIGIAAMCAELKYSYSYGKAAAVNAVCALLSPAVSILIMALIKGAFARILGLLLVSGIVAVPFIVRCIKEGLFRWEGWKFILRYSLPLLPGTLAAAVISQADKLIVSAYMGSEALAPYAVAHSIGVGLTFITASLGSALHPWIMRKLKSGEVGKVGETVGRIYVTLGALTVILTALAPEALSLLTPESYSVALPAVFPIAMATLPAFLLSVGTVVGVYEGRSYLSSAALVTGAAVNIGVNLLLVPRLEYLGAGLSLLLSYATAALVIYLLPSGRRVIGEIGVGGILKATALTAAVAAVTVAFYGSLPARLLLLILPVGALIFSAVGMKEYVTESY